MSWKRIRSWAVLIALLAAPTLVPGTAGAELPRGFSDEVAVRGLNQPTSVAFAADGRIFVTEKRGVVVSLSGPADESSRVIADLRTKVHSFYDRGLLSLALDPDFPRKPFLYVGYTYDAPPGATAPVWGKPDQNTDTCPGDADARDFPGCVVSSRVSRLKLGPHGVVRSERPLLSDWCQQFLSHSIGDLAFDREGALLVGGGEGASYIVADTGGYGQPENACGDPPGEGGALRAQDALSGGDPLGLDGTISRVDPVDGSPAPGNPSSAAGNQGRIVALGLRNPFRFAMRPGTDDLFVADVGWTSYEEIDVAPTGRRTDFGWPCFAGPEAEPSYAATGAPLCGALYADPGSATPPWFSYAHEAPVVEGEDCAPGDTGSAISGIAFDGGRRFPTPFDDAMFFADYVRGCIWAMAPGRFGAPRRSTLQVFESEARFPIDLVSGPGGLYYVDLIGGAIRRISYRPPTAEVLLQTRPPGLAVKIGTRTERGPSSVTVSRGETLTLHAPPRQRRGSRAFAFERWSDGRPRVHAVRAAASRTYTAVYSCRSRCGGRG